MRALPLVLVLLLAPPLAAAGADPHAAKDPRNFNWVEEGVLAIGGGGLNESQVDWLHAEGFRAIADVRAEHEDPRAHIEGKGMAFLSIPVDSASHLNETVLLEFLAWAKEQEDAGRPIYIHCTNGWHRAAAFVVAWSMAREGVGFDEAAREAVARRPGTVMRAASALLDLEAGLRDEPPLAVVLVSPLVRPEPGGTMPAHVEVYADGAPAVGAKVRVWSEESRMRLEGVTDAQGRFAFVYQAPNATFMDHVYARASLDGHVDGADNIEFIFAQPAKARGPLDVHAERQPDGSLVVRATSDGRALPARFVLSAAGWTAFEASPEGTARFADVPRGEVHVRAFSWGSEGGSATVAALPPPEPQPEPVPEPEPEPQPGGGPIVAPPPEDEPAQPPAPSPLARAAPLLVAGAGVAAAGAAGAVLLARVLTQRRRVGAGG